MTNPSVDGAREQVRLDALARYDILDTPSEETFDRITRIIRRILKVPIATVTFLDGHRQWFKSQSGMPACETERSIALCNRAIRQRDPMIVRDTFSDPRFAENPFVTGSPYLRFYLGVPLCSPDGQTIGTLCAMDTVPRDLDVEDVATLVDLGKVVMNELELRLLASTDGLTGALSRRAFRDDAGRALALAERHGDDVSCIAFDIDHFKSVNDTHGHAFGDTVLARSIAVCRDLLRTTDLIGRLGGEEFAVLLPHTNGHAALGVAEKLRQAIAAQAFEAAEGTFSVTASFGVATPTRGQRDIDSVLRMSDEALYAAKAAGRNQVRPSIVVDTGVSLPGRRVLKAGSIVFDGGQSVIDCTVKRLADDGASLAVVSTADVPRRFKLAITADSFLKACEVFRRAGTEIDVRFS